MAALWFIVEVTDSTTGREPLGEMLRFAVGPNFGVNPEYRGNNEIIEAATANGHEVSFVSSLAGVSRFHREKIRLAILHHLKYTLSVPLQNHFDVSIEPVLRVRIDA